MFFNRTPFTILWCTKELRIKGSTIFLKVYIRCRVLLNPFWYDHLPLGCIFYYEILKI